MKTNFLDNIISFLDPEAGLKRTQRRAAIDLIKRGYEGARRDRRTKGWKVNEYERTTNISEIKTLKERSRDLYKNNPYAFRAQNSIANNTTGMGIIPAIANDRLKKVWKDWAENTLADFDNNFDFYGLQNMCMKTMAVHGEVLILRIKTKDKNRLPLELKAVSTRYLDYSHDTDQTKTGGYITGGIEFDATGKRKGFWIYPKDPLITFQTSIFWKDEDVIHLFQKDEPEQTHGVPFGSPSMMSLHDFDDYADAQLMRQKIAACFSVFVTKTDGEMIADEPEDRLEKVEPGIIEHLEPGKSVTFASPPAAEGYGEYSRNVLTGIASGFGTTYENMTGDLSNVNFSSGRMGRIEFQRMIEGWQRFILIPKFCKKIWSWFVEAAILAGKLPKGTPQVVDWTVPYMPMIDPVKETNGLMAKVRAGFISWQEAVRSLGFTPEDVLMEMQQATVMFDKAGVKPKSDPRFDSTKEEKPTDNAGTDNTEG